MPDVPEPRATAGERKEEILEAARRVAARETLARLTIRAVASEAGVSPGLVPFYFDTKDRLLMDLLDRLLEQRHEGRLMAANELAELEPRQAFQALVLGEVERAAADREPVELFFDYWVLGMGHPEIRVRVRSALERYRTLLLGFAEGLLESSGEDSPGARREEAGGGQLTPGGLAAAALSLIEGCGLQSIIDPEGFDLESYRAALARLLASVPAPSPGMDPGARGVTPVPPPRPRPCPGDPG
ncbi:MAG: TetR/AcrR family transcriptional regulator [Longimicrobiales bacterium]